MLISAEVRWFWKTTLPRGLDAWFRSGPVSPGGGTPRVDAYLVDPGQRELGVKQREGAAGIQLKGLVDVRAPLPKPFDGRPQIWGKWTSHALAIDHLTRVAVRKRRWLRKYDTGGVEIHELALDEHERPRDPVPLPDEGCHVELASLSVNGYVEQWWTLGFEAFGPLATVEQSLRRTTAFMAGPAPDTLGGGRELSYPEWLHAIGRDGDAGGE